LNNRQRETFDTDELAIVLSHYPLGVIESITEFARGSRRSPKVGIVCQKGKFLLKRRDPERTKLSRITFAHRLQAHLAGHGFPLPRLVLPSNSNDPSEPVLIIRDQMYEMFEYVSGHSYAGTDAETRDAGRTLAMFHQLTLDFEPGDECPVGDYHDANAVRTGLNTIPASVSPHESVAGRQAELFGVVNKLYNSYDQAADIVRGKGIPATPDQVIHSDWHPGNMLFKNDQVAAVIDYDAARLSRRIIDVANGALQFSMLTGSKPENWPDELDEARLQMFLGAYETDGALTPAERESIPHLMIEALIAECVVPIARTGSFGHWHGFRFMQMVERKVAWLKKHATRIAALIERP
jgi:Ser/Thr protein kinase RdoA (MazF antagonist)